MGLLSPIFPHNPSYVDSPTASGTAVPTPTRAPRTVAAEAYAFHNHATEFGLPLPFDTWPVQNFNDITWRQGYGPTTFAYQGFPYEYRGSHNLHPGIDFSGGSPEKAVTAVCDGVIVGTRTTGSFTGYGLALRCFADDPADLDGDGYRNLSNIVVSYKHLDDQSRVYRPTSYQVVYEGEVLGYTRSYYRSQAARYCAENNDGVVGDCVITDDVAANVEGRSYQLGLMEKRFRPVVIG